MYVCMHVYIYIIVGTFEKSVPSARKPMALRSAAIVTYKYTIVIIIILYYIVIYTRIQYSSPLRRHSNLSRSV